ncbi:MAG: hypothetical protein KIH62_003730 [Candidatus Kerfeldbacteria bacterium]|nr:hypothetical protein [Candidatus Kerfeldbacteria bacterium]
MKRELIGVKIRQVAEDSPEVVDSKRKVKAQFASDVGSNRILGEHTIVQIDKLRDELKRKQSGDPGAVSSEDDIRERIQIQEGIFPDYRGMFARLARSDNPQHTAMMATLHQEFLDSSFAAKYSSEMQNYFSVTGDSVVGFSKEMPTQLVEVLFRAHIERYRQMEREFHERVALYKREFIDTVKEDIADGFVSMSEDLLERRVSDIDIEFNDTFQNYKGVYGQHAEHIIKVTPGMEGALERHIVFHELTHAISGTSFMHVTSEFSEKIRNTEEIHIAKAGLRFRTRRGKVFSFLNEAVTECLAALWSGIPADEMLYAVERQALSVLLEKGVARKSILDAYFENPEIDRSGKHPALRMPKTVALMREIRQNGGPGLLLNLERIFQE